MITLENDEEEVVQITCLYCLAVEVEVIPLLDPKDHARSPSSTPANHIPGFCHVVGKLTALTPRSSDRRMRTHDIT